MAERRATRSAASGGRAATGCAPSAPAAQRDALAPRAAQGHMAADTLIPALQRIAALHADLANAYRDLASNAENCLAGIAEQSLHASVPAQRIEPEFVTAETVGELLKVSPRTVHRMAEDGRLPSPVQISPGRSRWRLSDLERHFDDGGGK